MSFINVRFEDKSTKHIRFQNQLRLTGDDGRVFQLGSAVKEGGNGVVFEAICFSPDGEDEGYCAVKLLKELSEKRQDRFQNEIRILKELKHKKITKCFGFGIVELGEEKVEVPWMAMSLGGDNLRLHLDDTKAALEPRIAVGVSRQICNALVHVHPN